MTERPSMNLNPHPLTQTWWMTAEEVLNIPEEHLPMICLSNNYHNVVSTLINIRRRSFYGHAMWCFKRGLFASQGFNFTVVPVKDYLHHHRLKFWYSPKWTAAERLRLRVAIQNELDLPWHRRLYDPVAIFGQLIGVPQIQIPFLDICSDKGKYLREVDPEYGLCCPAADNLNSYLESRPDVYAVYGKYVRD